MGFLLRLIQFFVWLIFATWLGRKLLGRLFGSAARQSTQNAPRGRSARVTAHAHGGSQLFRDPVCGVHVTEGISVTLEVVGVVHHFCSVECRERFRAMASAQDSGSKAASA